MTYTITEIIIILMCGFIAHYNVKNEEENKNSGLWKWVSAIGLGAMVFISFL